MHTNAMRFIKNPPDHCTQGGLSLFGAIDTMVCHTCLEPNEGIQRFAARNAREGLCDFCQRESMVAALDEVIIYIAERLSSEYDDAANHLPYDGREGGYQGVTYETYDILENVGLELEDESLFQAIHDGLDDRVWCDADPAVGSYDEQLQGSWWWFCRLVKKERRFFFQTRRDDISVPWGFEGASAEEFLQTIADTAVNAGMVREIPQGTSFFRVRVHTKGAPPSTPLDFGPPPSELATMSNRMSPPGITCLYVSLEPETAMAETAKGAGEYYVGTLETTRPMRVLDLSSSFLVPSIFDDRVTHETRQRLRFLRSFVWQVSAPIERDERNHIEYVPTQIVTEYFRTSLCFDDVPLDGLVFRSARRRGGINLALFVGPEAMIPSDEDRRRADADNVWFFDRQHRDAWIRLVDRKYEPRR